MAKGLIDFLFDQIFDAERKRHFWEKLTERELKLVKLLGCDGNIRKKRIYHSLKRNDNNRSQIR